MKVGIFSDSHDQMTAIKKALKFFRKKKCQTLIHAGDIVAPFAARLIREFNGDVHVIYGNNDGERAGLAKVFPKIQDGPLQIEIDGVKFLVVHDYQDLPKKIPSAVEVVVFGHSHSPEVKGDKPIFINPGETCGWLSGKSTVVIFDTQKKKGKIHKL